MESAAPNVFNLTQKAIEHVKRTLARQGLEGHGLRVAVVAGGCSGYEYSLAFASEPQTGDRIIDHGVLQVFVGAESVERLDGTVLDYVDGLYGAGLKFANPQAVHSCGCGTSFATESEHGTDSDGSATS
ncbi:MAG: iron-sulfur cluster assembly accessory protein [Myxococcales bacterium]|nr:MAG: iron-sulfur cluster assembly accessory protein [Myxococcales bacterium]